jgi:hypothetical protein
LILRGVHKKPGLNYVCGHHKRTRSLVAARREHMNRRDSTGHARCSGYILPEWSGCQTKAHNVQCNSYEPLSSSLRFIVLHAVFSSLKKHETRTAKRQATLTLMDQDVPAPMLTKNKMYCS